jgi:hypothetical protein
MGSVLFAFGTGTLSAASWLLGGTLGTLVFVLVLLLTGEITRGDLRRGAGSLAAAISRLIRSGARQQ